MSKFAEKVLVLTNQTHILCRAAPFVNAEYEVKVKVDGKWLNDDKPGTFCYGRCIFYVGL